RITDPRLVVGLTLFVFVTLISLPYTLDFFESQRYAHDRHQEIVVAEDSSGPSLGALSMVGATMFGQGVKVPESVVNKLGGGMMPTREKAPEAEASDSDLKSNADLLDTVNKSAHDTADSAAPIAAQSAQDTVSEMLAASGMAQKQAPLAPSPVSSVALSASQAPSAAFGSAALPLPPVASPASVQASAAQAAYGGAIQSGSNYYVYIPNQQNYGSSVAAPAQQAAPAVYSQAPAGAQNASAVYNPAPSGPAYAPAGFAAAPAAQAYDPRSAFNPQTSAIVSPMGQRHSSSVPMLPAGTGADGSQRFRVWASR
ncbi:MAG: hypothetical protein K2X27_24745, partial [Candidatus Obscuribacterales bacterium]|nr:hypothetical protein [Candidatus Obscuribacterales bacterium]